MLDKQRIGTFVLGGIAGALAGILFAPRSGKELRNSVTTRAGEARERGRETYFEAQERLQERITEVRERPSDLGDRGSEGTRTARDDVAELRHGTSEPPEIDVEPPFGTPPEAEPPLREAPRDALEPPGSTEAEKLRRRILETRSRLRAHLEGSDENDE